MTGASTAGILRHLDETVCPDRDLLARFLRERDQTAFRELVTRYGPLVLSVCRRTTGHREDAEDSFQAVFLVLAMKAKTIRNTEVLGSWLHGVALRVAKTARRSAERRRKREAAVSVMVKRAVPENDPVFEIGPILDEELAALPSRYRDAIVLCDLRGVSREEAAVSLAIPEGTLSSRLAVGRKKLAERLTRRGIALSSAAILSAFSQSQAAVVSSELIAKTRGLAADWMAGGALPRPLAKLTDGGMTVRKTLSIGLFAMIAAVAGVVYAAQPIAPPTVVEPPTTPVVAGKPAMVEQPLPALEPPKQSQAYTIAPSLSRIVDLNLTGVETVRWNALGTRLAVAGSRRSQEDRTVVESIPSMVIVGINSKVQALSRSDLQEQSKLVGFTPDGKSVLTDVREYQFVSGVHRLDYWRINDDDGFRSDHSIKLSPMETQEYVFAPDGKTFRTVALERDHVTKDVKKLTVLEVEATTGKPLKSLLSLLATTFALSSDGKRLAAMGAQDSKDEVTVYDVDRAARLVSYRLPETKVAERFRLTREKAQELRNGKIPATVIKKLQAALDPDVVYSEDEWRKLLVDSLTADELKQYQETILNESRLTPSQKRSGMKSWSVAPTMVFSADGSRLLVYLGYGEESGYGGGNVETVVGPTGKTIVLNALTGKPMPALEGLDFVRMHPGPNALSGDGRLLALSGTNHVLHKKTRRSTDDGDGTSLQLQQAFVTVWDTETGKVIKSWDGFAQVAFSPVQPILAVLEFNGEFKTRLGFWDFTVEAAEKKQ